MRSPRRSGYDEARLQRLADLCFAGSAAVMVAVGLMLSLF